MNDETLNIGVPIELKNPDDFLLIKESLTRIGVANQAQKKLYQSCLVLHKRGKYYIMHFKEMFLLDGKSANISEEDIERRNLIAALLEDWGLLKIKEPQKFLNKASMTAIKILSFSEKSQWEKIQKYSVGVKFNHKGSKHGTTS